jgi:hypothetical protein
MRARGWPQRTAQVVLIELPPWNATVPPYKATAPPFPYCAHSCPPQAAALILAAVRKRERSHCACAGDCHAVEHELTLGPLGHVHRPSGCLHTRSRNYDRYPAETGMARTRRSHVSVHAGGPVCVRVVCVSVRGGTVWCFCVCRHVCGQVLVNVCAFVFACECVRVCAHVYVCVFVWLHACASV